MSLVLKNTRGEEYAVSTKGTVSIYSCGPTVYAPAHIGNLSSFVYADILARTIRASGATVAHTMNITDVDDKTIAGDQQAHDGSSSVESLKRYTAVFRDRFIADTKLLNVDLDANFTLKDATDHIAEMQQLILTLLEKGIAYIVDSDGIYFSLQEYKKSGGAYNLFHDDQEISLSQRRIRNDEHAKDDIHDFVLWKAHKPGEPFWEFEFEDLDMPGRPGWHIECSAMAGKHVNIHTGGIDLPFPHHENEVAQSQGAHGHDVPFAEHFMHSEFLMIDGKKMSKSLNNFYVLEDILNDIDHPRKDWVAMAFRLLILNSSYQKQGQYTKQLLAEQLTVYKRLLSYAALAYQPTDGVYRPELFASGIYESILSALHSNLNSHKAIAALSGNARSETTYIGLDQVGKFKKLIYDLDLLLGLDLAKNSIPRDFSIDKLSELVGQRDNAKKEKDYDTADKIRSKLVSSGIGLRDISILHGGSKTIWYFL